MMFSRISLLRPVLSNLCLGIAILVFASGFFPYKPFIAGHNAFTPHEARAAPKAPFDRVIFMVVDALRSDFVYSEGSGFAFVQQLIREGHAMPFTAHASSPTITMPKIKAITTGSVPSFIDVILNFAESDSSSTLANVDTWLHQLRRKQEGKIIMYGDDTWLKLFPGLFDRADGTSSFFVSDFTEVDNNVTRHIDMELGNSDWNGWIMHYLGLDHIGHKSGPQSPHMRPKQHEMDAIVKRIYDSINNLSHLQSTVFVLCGDHGMNEAGNHGGSSPGETSPALVFISPSFNILQTSWDAAALTANQEYNYYKRVQQADIAPTLSALLGIPLPLNNLGVLIPDFLDLWKDDADKIHLMKQNVRQMHRILQEAIGSDLFVGTSMDSADCLSASDNLSILKCGWLAQQVDMDSKDVQIEILYRYLRVAQGILSSTASNYDLTRLYLGITLCTIVFVAQALSIAASTWTKIEKISLAFAGILTSLYALMMFASSFVEEEHQFWFWIGGLLISYLFVLKTNRLCMSGQRVGLFVLAASLLRLVRRWNQAGQKFAGYPDIGRTVLGSNPNVLWLLVLLTYAYFGQRLTRACLPLDSSWLNWHFSVAITSMLLLFKLGFTSADAPELVCGWADRFSVLSAPGALLFQARAIFSLIFLISCSKSYSSLTAKTRKRNHQSRDFSVLFTMFLLMQTRVNNTPLFLIFEMLALLIHRGAPQFRSLTSVELATCSIVMQYISFFALGGTNGIASVDLSNAYNGVSGYNVLAVGILTFVSNWAGPLWWALSSSISTVPQVRRLRAFAGRASVYDLFTAGTLAATMTACTLLRTHLFIWTVFSPKYLYSIAWSFLQHMTINLATTGVLSWISHV